MSAPYQLLDELVAAHHPHLADAEIALVFKLKSSPDEDGIETLGACRKCSERDRELHGFDFIIELNQVVWDNPEFGESRQRALLDHELCHAQVSMDEEGEEKMDAHGRPAWRVRKHAIEEFREIIERHGLYKVDLEDFAKTLLAKAKPLAPQPLLDGATVE